MNEVLENVVSAVEVFTKPIDLYSYLKMTNYKNIFKKEGAERIVIEMKKKGVLDEIMEISSRLASGKELHNELQNLINHTKKYPALPEVEETAKEEAPKQEKKDGDVIDIEPKTETENEEAVMQDSIERILEAFEVLEPGAFKLEEIKKYNEDDELKFPVFIRTSKKKETPVFDYIDKAISSDLFKDLKVKVIRDNKRVSLVGNLMGIAYASLRIFDSIRVHNTDPFKVDKKKTLEMIKNLPGVVDLDKIDFNSPAGVAAMRVIEDAFKSEKPDYAAIAEQYGLDLSEMIKLVQTKEGQDKLYDILMDKIAEAEKSNAAESTEQQNTEGSTDQDAKADPEDPIIVSDGLIDSNKFLEEVDWKMRQLGIVPLFAPADQRLIKMTMIPENGTIDNPDNKFVYLDIKGAILGKEYKWSPILGKTPAELIHSPWNKMNDEGLYGLSLYAKGEKKVEEIFDDVYSDAYRNMIYYVSMKQVMGSKQLKSDNDKKAVYLTLYNLFMTGELQKSRDVDPGTYFRLQKYTDQKNIRFISDGKTNCMFNNGKPVESGVIYTIEIKDGKLNAYYKPIVQEQEQKAV